MEFTAKKTTTLPYSYHTFLLAFRFDCEFNEFADLGNWQTDSLRQPGDTAELLMNYQTYQYFTPEARRLMFNEGRIKRYKYHIPDSAERLFAIRKALATEETDEATGKQLRKTEEYRLTIDNIRITVFHNHIAIMQFELENHDPNHQTLDSVKRINEYGRRINLPYIVRGDAIHTLVADSVSILGNEVSFSCFGEKALKEFGGSTDNQNIIPPIMNLIRELLPESDEKTEIAPVIDDRMFVCCLVRDQAFSEKVMSLQKDDTDPIPVIGKDIYADRELSNEIYSFAYIDADDSSCQSPEMREALLKRCIYSRWRDLGTIDVITHHSFVRITGSSKGIIASVINPFLTEYVIMAAGVLLQRATLMKLSKECADISADYFAKDNPKINDEALNDRIRKLKRDYVYAQNNIFLNQFTAQEQGIDEFDMLRNELYIKDSLKSLSYKVNGIYDFITENAEDEENSLLNALTVFGLPLSLIQTLAVIISFTYIGEDSAQKLPLEWLLFGIVLACSIIISVIGIKQYKRRNTRKGKRNKTKK